MLRGVLNERVVWLVEHHLDLLIAPSQTQLKQLQQLRHWDLSGRDVNAEVISP